MRGYFARGPFAADAFRAEIVAAIDTLAEDPLMWHRHERTLYLLPSMGIGTILYGLLVWSWAFSRDGGP